MTAFLFRGLVLDAAVLATVVLAAGYLSRVVAPRPPVGRFTWSDVCVMIGMLVLMPFAYAQVPSGPVAALFGLVTFLIVQVTLSPWSAAGSRPWQPPHCVPSTSARL